MGLINQKNGLSCYPSKPLVSVAYRRNIDFKTGDNIFYNILNIMDIYSIVKFMLGCC